MEIYIGRVLRTKGLKGELIVYFFSEKLICKQDDFLFFENPVLNKKLGPYQVENVISYKFKKGKKIFILKLKEINHIDQAETLRSCYIGCDITALPENFYLNKDLLYSKVVLKDSNIILGKIVDIITANENYKLLLVRTKRREEIFIPFIRPVIDKVDVENKKVIVNRIDGITV